MFKIICVCVKSSHSGKKTDRFIENWNFRNIFIQLSLEKVSVKHNKHIYIKSYYFLF